MTGGTGQNVDDEKVDVSEGRDEVSWDILVERSRKERGGEGNKWRANTDVLAMAAATCTDQPTSGIPVVRREQ